MKTKKIPGIYSSHRVQDNILCRSPCLCYFTAYQSGEFCLFLQSLPDFCVQGPALNFTWQTPKISNQQSHISKVRVPHHYYLVLPVFLVSALSVGVTHEFIVDLICISLVTHSVTSLVRYLFKSFAHLCGAVIELLFFIYLFQLSKVLHFHSIRVTGFFALSKKFLPTPRSWRYCKSFHLYARSFYFP